MAETLRTRRPGTSLVARGPAPPHPIQRRSDLPGQRRGGRLPARGLPEEEERRQGLAGDFHLPEDGHHLLRELADFSRPADSQIRDRQIETGERGLEGVVCVQKRLADFRQKPAGPLVIPQAGGDPPLDPFQAEAVLRGAVRRRQILQLRKESRRLPVASGLGEVVAQVVEGSL